MSSDEKYDENTTGLQLEVHGNEKLWKSKKVHHHYDIGMRVNKNFIGGDEDRRKGLGSVDTNKYANDVANVPYRPHVRLRPYDHTLNSD